MVPFHRCQCCNMSYISRANQGRSLESHHSVHCLHVSIIPQIIHCIYLTQCPRQGCPGRHIGYVKLPMTLNITNLFWLESVSSWPPPAPPFPFLLAFPLPTRRVGHAWKSHSVAALHDLSQQPGYIPGVTADKRLVQPDKQVPVSLRRPIRSQKIIQSARLACVSNKMHRVMPPLGNTGGRTVSVFLTANDDRASPSQATV